MSRFTLPLLLFLVPYTVLGQDSTRDFSGGWQLFAGGQFADYSGVNSRLTVAGYDKLKSAAYEFGAGISGRIRKVRFGIDGSFIGGDQAAVSSSGFNLHIYTFSDKIRTHGMIFSPQLGITSQLFAIDITKPSTATNFNEALTSDPNRVQLTYYNTFLDIGMVIQLRNVKHSGADLPIFRFGYRYGLENAAWQVRGGDLPDGPHDRAGNFYLAAAIGIIR